MFGSILKGVTGLGGAIFGGVSAGKNRRRALREVRGAQADNQALFDSQYYADATQRADAQNLMSHLRDNLKKRGQQSANVAAVTGATPEAQLAQREQDNQVITDTYRDIGARGEAHKDKVMDRYVNQKNALTQGIIDMRNQRAQSGEQMMSNGLDAMGSALGNLPMPKFLQKK